MNWTERLMVLDDVTRLIGTFIGALGCGLLAWVSFSGWNSFSLFSVFFLVIAILLFADVTFFVLVWVTGGEDVARKKWWWKVGSAAGEIAVILLLLFVVIGPLMSR